MASLPSDFLRHSLTVPLGACVTPHSSMSLPIGCPYSIIFHQIDYHVLKHTRRPISSASLGGRFGKAKSSKSPLPFPCILPVLLISASILFPAQKADSACSLRCGKGEHEFEDLWHLLKLLKVFMLIY